MSKIIPKLNLNKTPQLVENNSLIFAKNIKLAKDGSIGVDSSFKNIPNVFNNNYVGHIVGLNGIIYIFETDGIYAYNESNQDYSKIECSWTYSGGEIDGIVTTNNTNETIITICEHHNEKDIPIKHINLDRCKSTDDESLYTQTPNIPITNLHLQDYYSNVIPNGVYQFFIRYKIREDFYTTWYPCSGELHAGVNQKDVTVQGSIRYIDTNKDCSKSFILNVEHLLNINYYSEFQLGFILSNNDAVVARNWKNFNYNTKEIKFNYDNADIEEIDIDDLLKTNYELFNVKNITYYKDKEYISNFKETDFNPNIDVSNIKVELLKKDLPLDNIINISNKPLGGIDVVLDTNYDLIEINTIWGDNGINALLFSDNTDINVNSTEINKTYTNQIVGTAKTYWHDEVEINNQEIDVYSIAEWTNNMIVNDNNVIDNYSYAKYTSDNEEIYDPNYLTNYLGTISTDTSMIQDYGRHPISKIEGLRHKWLWRGGHPNKDIKAGFWTPGLHLFNKGMYDIDIANNVWKEGILDHIKKEYPQTIITKITLLTDKEEIFYDLYDAENEDIVSGNPINIKGIVVTSDRIATQEDINNVVLNKISQSIKGISSQGIYYIAIDEDGHCAPLLNIAVEYYTCNYSVSETKNIETEVVISNIFDFKTTINKLTSVYSFTVNNIDTTINNITTKTLMPYTDYEFYIHFVKENGITTNGYYIGTKNYKGYTKVNEVNIIYPRISNVVVPDDYKAWFISIYQSGKNIAKGFNHYTDDEYNYIDCLECDTLLYNLTDNIKIYSNRQTTSPNDDEFNLITDEAEYFSSGNSRVPKLFGNAGVIRWKRTNQDYINNDFDDLVASIEIPASDKTTGVITLYANQIDKDGNSKVKELNIDLSKRSNSEKLDTYISKYISVFCATFGGNLTYSISYKINPFYDNEISREEILSLSSDKYYYFDEDNNLTEITNDEIVELNEDEYNANVAERNRLHKLLTDTLNITIQNARLAADLSNSNDENFIPKASRTGAKLIKSGNITQNTIVTVCKSDDKYAESSRREISTCEEGTIPVFEEDLSNITLASATINQLADASDATQALIQPLISGNVNIKTTLATINASIANYETKSKNTYKVYKYIKNGVVTVKYDKSTIFTLNDVIDTISITVSSIAVNDINNIKELGLNYINTYSINRKSFTAKSDYLVAKVKENSYWVVIDSDKSNNKHKQLIKITPYILNNVSSYSNNDNMNLPAFICSVEKPDHNRNDNYYISGTDVYRKVITNNESIQLEEITGIVPNTISKTYYIPSNFNLNCLTLREDLTNAIRTYITENIEYDDVSETDQLVETQGRHTFKAFNSLVVSSVYELPTMYRDYIRKTYIVKANNVITKFDNTIRSSDVNTDTVYRNIYRFESDDYYNVPANRGIITKLFTLLDTIFVHNTHALYKFSGKNTLTTEGDYLTMRPTQLFDTGISTMLDSTNGYGGLSEKHHGLVMSSAYIFYDKFANTIYGFAEQGGIINISESIQKLINNYHIDDVRFIGDEANDRFYVNFEIGDNNLCLSFNLRSKTFISIHDFDYIKSFNTRNNTYILNIDNSNSWKLFTLVECIETNDNTTYGSYGSCTKESIIKVQDSVNTDNNKYYSCVDVIYNEYYDKVKILEYVNWISSNILKFDDNTNNINLAEEVLDNEYPGYKLRIYTDQCHTNLIDLTEIANNQNILNLKDIQHPRYNCGVWSLNYFRDIKYRNPNNNDSIYAQDDSLIYGKYIVFRIIFNNTNFKFENVSFNVKNYEKV